MDEKRRLIERSETFKGRDLVTGDPPASGIQEIYDFLFFKLYLLS
jgi:hypothetical protein